MDKLKLLITGATGKLGKAILARGILNKELLIPSHNELDITDKSSVENYFNTHTINEIIHCAAIASVGLCEKDPSQAISTNSIGTAYLVEAARKQKTRFIYISTDYVYPCEQGNYKESDPTIPFTMYGWSKLGGELSVRTLENYCIIRTSFFDPDNIPFDTAFTDSFCSKLPISEIAKDVIFLLDNTFNGIVNVGCDRISLYDLYKKYKPQIKPESMLLNKEIIKRAKDSSLDISLFERIKGKLNGN
ncbi:NAD(P)-dependent oxidoreductase [Candidatus Pacearchaeota archaeon]|nr:NAD(P)-dependent oxidoreductase [Candidatus Pacearchaeota archaeon]